MKRSTVWSAVAVALALAGVVAVLIRPTAPHVGTVVTELDDFSPAVLAAVEDYRTERYLGALAAAVITVAVPGLFVATRRGRHAIDRLRTGGPVRTATVVAGLISLATALAVLPLAWWLGYVRERRWGFATGSVWGWLRDRAITDGVGILVAVVLAMVFVWLRRRWPRDWHLRLTVAGTVLTALLAFASPLVIQPLLLDTTPLSSGATRTAVTEVLERAGEPELDILVGDASRRTTKVNAFVTGLGPSRQVVLYDTLLELPPEQVAVVVAHELAHREHADIARGVLASATGLLLGLTFLRWVLRRAGEEGPTSAGRAVAILVLFLAAAQLVAAPAANWVSRRAEASADHRALELTDAAGELIAAQRRFVVRDLADPSPPWWVMGLWGTHPSVEDRIGAAVSYAHTHGLELPDRRTLLSDEPHPPQLRHD